MQLRYANVPFSFRLCSRNGLAFFVGGHLPINVDILLAGRINFINIPRPPIRECNLPSFKLSAAVSNDPPPSSPLKVTVAPRCVAMMQQQQQQDAFVSFSIRFITRARLAFTRQTFFSPIDDCSPYDSFAHVASISDPQVTYVSPGEATCDRLINEFTASWTRVACFSFFFVFFFQLTRDPQSVVCHDRLSRYFRLRPDITIPRAR